MTLGNFIKVLEGWRSLHKDNEDLKVVLYTKASGEVPASDVVCSMRKIYVRESY